MSKKLMEVREKFIKVLNDPAHLNAGSRDIAEAFLNSHRSEISNDAWDEVCIIGLIHLLGSLRRRRPILTSNDGTRSLFADFDIEPIVVVRVMEEGKGLVEKNKELGSLTLPEAIDYEARHSKERAANGKRISEWRRLIKRVKPFMIREGMTLAEGLTAAETHARDASKRKAASSR